MAGPMHQRQVANATTDVSRHNAIDAGPPGFGRSTATSVGAQQTEGDENEMGNILQEIAEMQATAVDGGRRHVISSCKNITIGMECAGARNVTVKHENDEDSSRQPRVLDIDRECARRLQKELDEEYVIEEASRQANRLKTMITPGVVVCVVETDSSKDAEFEEWSDHEHDWLVENDRRLKEQEDKDAELAKKCQEEVEWESKEQQAKDEELASKCQHEIEQKAMEQLANDDHVARMYQKMYDQNATDEKIRVATTHHGQGTTTHHSQGTGAGGHRASYVGVQTKLDDFFHCRTGLGRQRTTEGRRCVIRKKRRCSKKSRKGRAKQRRRVRFSNIVQTICPIESSESDDSSTDDGNIASGEDNGDPAPHRVANIEIKYYASEVWEGGS